jgi:hypothetical protein
VTFYSWPVYRSLGCATSGLGDLYAPSAGVNIIKGFHFHLGCNIPGQWELP